jgi:hypothetical protein
MRKQLGLAHASTAEWRVFCRGAGLARFTALLQHTYGVHEQYNNCIYTFMGSLISPLTSPHRASIDRQWVSCACMQGTRSCSISAVSMFKLTSYNISCC